MDWQTILNISGFIFGAVGIILTIYFYFKSKESKEPVFFYLTFQDIKKLNEENSKIKVVYDNEEVEQVFTTYLWIWNQGRRPIKSTDIPDQQPISIKLLDSNKNAKILDWQLLKVSRDEINFGFVGGDKGSLGLGFDFLDYKDGAAIEIQHTGNAESKFSVDGVILGCPEGIGRIKARVEFNFLGIYIHASNYESGNRRFTKPKSFEKYLLLIFTIPTFLLAIVIFIGQWVHNSTALNFITNIFGSLFVLSIFFVISNFKTMLAAFIEYPFPNSLYLEVGKK
jgi:hypothetical protein